MTGEVCYVCRSKRSHDTRLYRFPKDPDLRQKWREVLNMRTDSRYLLMCHRHFHRSMISETGRRLTAVAYPCYLPPSFNKGAVDSPNPPVSDISNQFKGNQVAYGVDEDFDTIQVSDDDDDDDQLVESYYNGNEVKYEHLLPKVTLTMSNEADVFQQDDKESFSQYNNDFQFQLPQHNVNGLSFPHSISNRMERFPVNKKNSVPSLQKFSLEEKIEIIKEFERSKHVAHIPKMFNCRMKQIKRTLQHRVEILVEYKRFKQGGMSRLKRSPCPFKRAVGNILYEFLRRCRFYQIEINDIFLLEKAKEIANMLNLRSFKAQPYWLKRFRERFHLTKTDWATWNFTNPPEEGQESLDLQTIMNELRSSLGEAAMPSPAKLDKDLYKSILAELLQNDKNQRTNFVNKRESDQYYSNYVEDDEKDSDAVSLIEIDEDDNNILSFDDISNQAAEAAEAAETADCTENSMDVTDKEDPMEIDSYQTAISYLYPLEQFSSTKGNDQANIVLRQLNKTLSQLASREVLKTKPKGNDGISIVNEVQIEGYQDAVEYLIPLEDFVMSKENLRIVGLINQLEIIFKEKC